MYTDYNCHCRCQHHADLPGRSELRLVVAEVPLAHLVIQACMCMYNCIYIHDHMLSRKNLPTMWGLKPRWARWDGRRGMERGTLDFKKEIGLLTFFFVIWMKMRANHERSSPHEVLLPTARGVASLVKYKTIIFFLSSWLKVKQLYFAWAG